MSSLVEAKTEFFCRRGFAHRMRGVVHVGAHEGQEIPWYVHRGHTPVLAFEANPAVARRLQAAYEGHPDVHVVGCALGDVNRWADLWIPRHLHDHSDDEQSASFLRADRESGYDWGGRDLDGRTVQVPVFRFDDWIRTQPQLLARVNVLVVDVQGFEHQVLGGFGDAIDAFDLISVECSRVPIYKGGAPAAAVEARLLVSGFERATEIVSHDDVMFIRRGL